MNQLTNKSINPLFGKTLRAVQGKSYDRGFSLPGIFYTDPAWMQTECDELFAKDWVCLGRVEEVNRPGDYITFDHVGEPIVVVHGQDGVIRALSNVCRHRGTVIANDKGNTKKFMCPYHHWVYDTTGQLLNAPHLDAHQVFDVKNCRLPELRCELWHGFIFVSLNQTAPSLNKELSALDKVIKNYHLEQMTVGYLADELWDTNWKCLLENFMEGYHLTPLHKDTLHKVNPTRLCTHLKSGKRHFGYKVGFSTRLASDRIGHADLSDAEMDTCVMAAIPPGLTLGIGSDYSSFLCMRPETPGRVRVKMGLIFFGDNWPKADIDNAIELFQCTMREDKEVLIRVQRGLASRFHQPGPLAPREMEGTIWDFYQYLSRRLTTPLKSDKKSKARG